MFHLFLKTLETRRATVALGVLFILLGWFFWMRSTTLHELTQKVAHLDLAVESIRYNAKAANHLTEDTEEMHALNLQFESELWLSDREATNLRFFYGYANRLHVNLQTPVQGGESYLAVKADGNPLAYSGLILINVPFSLKGTASFSDLMAFLYEIKTVAAFVYFETLNITGNNGDAKSLLNFQLVLRVLGKELE
jgi:hypothetical protein